MNRIGVALLITLACAIALFNGVAWLVAAEPAAEPVVSAVEGLDARYARAYLQLAQTDLQIAYEVNEKVRGAYPESALEPLRQVVAIADEQLKHALQQNSHDLHTVHIRQAEAVVAEAERALQRVMEANHKLPGLNTPTELRRARLRVEVAKLALAKARSVNSHNEAEHTQWQLDELRKDILLLRSELERRPH